ncbi:acyltransferase [Enterobacter hormaechei]|uniref:acyltransferase family protein n=1 Tax=Enterobacter hormaechei TaxID=158836 RepID=UPI0018C26483|nr:acyltransferase [Enterobacter hormaechei]HDS5274931.1 acyltransferase [Enterobacter hormaechei subsp. steigerwaltii]EHF5015191.1 acyltransferase [Enterobacter hormaechei]MBG0672974.1 acyltransferase [Enterobacter hormaechei]HEM8739384.1 acyltransferase [Enterobacter hormaechei]HEO9435076.1 acyltransferase [Enterobacter hormaechei subsp. steigerwaltii]
MKTDSSSNVNREVLSIQYLRGIAAIIVFFSHFKNTINEISLVNIRYLGDSLFSNGGFGVDLFFVISGFVIALSTEKDLGRKMGAISFVIKRAFRIYPLLIVGVIAIGYLQNIPVSKMLWSMIPLHLDYMSKPPFFGYNSLYVAWTITFELSFYLLFMVSMLVSHKYRAIVCTLAIFSLFIIIRVTTGSEITLSATSPINHINSWLMPVASIYSSSMMFNFIYGMIAYYAYKHIRTGALHGTILNTCLITMIVCSFFMLIGNSAIMGHGPEKWGVVSFALILSAAMYEKNAGIFRSRFLLHLGAISYSLYLIHPVVLYFLSINNWFDIRISGFPKFVIGTCIVILTSTITYKLLEVRSSALGKMLLARLR